MAITHLKKATKTPETETDTARAVVTEMLAAIEAGGEQAARDYALKLDRWSGPIVLDEATIEAARARCRNRSGTTSTSRRGRCAASPKPRRNPAATSPSSCRRASGSAEDGPRQHGGCYVPTGRYAHIASAYMSIATAKAAGVKTVVACSAPFRGDNIHPSVL